MTAVLAGVYAPLVTPFDDDERVAIAAFATNAATVCARGAAGVVIAGSTGEAALLEDDERAALCAAARAAVPAGALVIQGCGAESTRQTIARCRAAAAEGADGVLVVAPHYYAGAMGTAELRAHYRRVADASPVPVLLYNIPRYMHFALPPALVGELAQHPNVRGIKDSSGDPALLREYLAAQHDGFAVLTGAGGRFLEGLALGARGGILAVADFATGLAVEVYAAHAQGDAAAAAAAQARLTPLAAVIVAELGVPAIKHACDLVGLTGGRVRGPLLPLDGAARARVRGLLEEAGVLGVLPS